MMNYDSNVHVACVGIVQVILGLNTIEMLKLELSLYPYCLANQLFRDIVHISLFAFDVFSVFTETGDCVSFYWSVFQ